MIELEDYAKYGSFVMIIMSFVFIIITGIFFGIIHYTLDATEDAFRSVDCVIENNTLVDSCQDLFELGLYPFLALRHIFVWLSFFLIFGVTLGILLLGYQSGKSPVIMGLLFLFLSVLVYIAIEVSNMYRTMLMNETFRAIMVDFTVYNRLMLSFPWYVFIVGLFSLMIGVVNYQRSKVNSPADDLDY